MRAAAIFGPGNIARSMLAFQRNTGAEWTSLIEQADIAVVFGGDGTVHRHLETFVELEIPVVVVPCGSGNDFAHALGIRSARDAIRAWHAFAAGNRPRSIDLGVIRELPGGPVAVTPTCTHASVTPATPCSENRITLGAAAASRKYFCCVAGVGIDTEIAKDANAQPKWIRSHGGYALAASREILRFAPFSMKVSSNGTQAAFRPTILAAVANAPAYGHGMKIAPNAKLDDGRLDVCTVRAMDPFKLFCMFPTIYFGRHLTFKEVEYEQAPSVKIETEYPLDVYADGEFVGKTPAEFSVARSALKVVAGQ